MCFADGLFGSTLGRTAFSTASKASLEYLWMPRVANYDNTHDNTPYASLEEMTVLAACKTLASERLARGSAH